MSEDDPLKMGEFVERVHFLLVLVKARSETKTRRYSFSCRQSRNFGPVIAGIAAGTVDVDPGFLREYVPAGRLSWP
jgi:hypothetical protein